MESPVACPGHARGQGALRVRGELGALRAAVLEGVAGLVALGAEGVEGREAVDHDVEEWTLPSPQSRSKRRLSDAIVRRLGGRFSTLTVSACCASTEGARRLRPEVRYQWRRWTNCW